MKKFILIVVVLSMAIISCQDLNVPDEVTVKQEYFPAPEIRSLEGHNFSPPVYMMIFTPVPNALKYYAYVKSEINMQIREFEVGGVNYSSLTDDFAWSIEKSNVQLPSSIYSSTAGFNPPYHFGIRAVSCNGVQSAITWSENTVEP